MHFIPPTTKNEAQFVVYTFSCIRDNIFFSHWEKIGLHLQTIYQVTGKILSFELELQNYEAIKNYEELAAVYIAQQFGLYEWSVSIVLLYEWWKDTM